MTGNTHVWVRLTLLAMLCMADSAMAENTSRGQPLHQKHCTSCHIGMFGGDGSAIYTRENHRVRNLPSLTAQVRRCETNLELKWFDEDIDAVTEFLNLRYYKFE